MFVEEIRAGREEGGIQMHEVEALNSGNNQTVKFFANFANFATFANFLLKFHENC